MHETQPQLRTDNRAARRGVQSLFATLAPPLTAAIICTYLIGQAIETALTGKANGDLMVLVCPLLGALFISIPTAQAWVASVKIVRNSHVRPRTPSADK